jgi:hypothetical protein
MFRASKNPSGFVGLVVREPELPPLAPLLHGDLAWHRDVDEDALVAGPKPCSTGILFL